MEQKNLQIKHNAENPRVVQAAQIALIVMKKLKCATWNQVVETSKTKAVRDYVILSIAQQELLEGFPNILASLSVTPLVTVVACDMCERYGFYDKRPVGKKCFFTQYCEGTLFKASATQPKVLCR